MQTLDLDRMMKSYYTDERILAAESEYEQTYRHSIVVTIALMVVVVICLATSLVFELGVTTFAVLFVLGTLVQYLCFRYYSKKLDRSGQKVLDAINTVGQENHQIIEDYFANLRRQEAVADETAE